MALTSNNHRTSYCPLKVRRFTALTGLLIVCVGLLPENFREAIAQPPDTATAGQAASADEPAEEKPLIDTAPFDIVVLNAAAGGKSVKIEPIADRKQSQRPSDNTRLEIVLLSHPDRRYEVLWRDIERIDLYERMIYDEAQRKLKERDFTAAFMNLSFLIRNYPKMERLEILRQEFLYQSAIAMFAEARNDFNRYFQTLSTLEELRATAPNYEVGQVQSGLSSVIDSLMTYYKNKNDMGSAKKLLDRLDASYGDSIPSVKRWKEVFLQAAETRRDEAISLMESGKYREARKAALEMENISSEIQGGAELVAEIRRRHPMVRVGVMQAATKLDPCSLLSWSAKRAGALVYRPVVKFLQTGTEGGRYEFTPGKMRLSEDHQSLSLSVDPAKGFALSAFELTQVLASRATPGTKEYDASWAAIVKSLATPSGTQIVVQMQRPHVLPHALLRFAIPGSDDEVSPLPGPYALETNEGVETVFKRRMEGLAPSVSGSPSTAASGHAISSLPSQSAGAPVEVIEVFYDDPSLAVNDLLRGEIDVIDQIFPGDARRYGQSQLIKMGSYALPSVHLLVPISAHPYLANDKFRRALMYATNREEILRGELLNSDDVRDGRLISGPFPVGLDKNDPLSYAYDPAIEPIAYDARLAKLLLYMAERDINAKSYKMKQPPPEKRPLRVAVPDFELARVAVQALIQQWSLVGVKAELVTLNGESAFDPQQQCDLVYVAATMWEPAVDIERLIGGNSLAATSNPFIVQALTRLRQARGWRDVRTSLQDIHRLVDYHLPLLPLWQITDRFAYSPQLQGLSTQSVSLYDNIDNWRISAPTLPVSSRSSNQ